VIIVLPVVIPQMPILPVTIHCQTFVVVAVIILWTLTRNVTSIARSMMMRWMGMIEMEQLKADLNGYQNDFNILRLAYGNDTQLMTNPDAVELKKNIESLQRQIKYMDITNAPINMIFQCKKCLEAKCLLALKDEWYCGSKYKKMYLICMGCRAEYSADDMDAWAGFAESNLAGWYKGEESDD